MEKQSLQNIIYSLNIQDVQTVAVEEIGRELSATEIESITDTIASNINWYDAIANSFLKLTEHTVMPLNKQKTI